MKLWSLHIWNDVVK